jgi:hypothetical protein
MLIQNGNRWKWPRWLALLAILTTLGAAFFACGGNEEDSDNDDGGDDTDDDNGGDDPGEIVIFPEVDFGYTVGGLVSVDVASRSLKLENAENIVSTDVTFAMWQDDFYVVNGWQFDNVQKIDPFKFHTKSQYSTGNGTYPASMAMVAECRGYVPLFARQYLLVFNPCNGREIARIDFSEYADTEDGIPEMFASIYHDGKVVVGIEKLDRNNNWIARYTGRFVVIDPDTNAVEKVIDSNTYVPFTFEIDTDTNRILALSSGDIYTPGRFGGIEEIDIDAGTADLLIGAEDISETAFPIDIAYAGNGRAYIIVFARDMVSPAFLTRVDLNAGTVDPEPIFTAYSDPDHDITGSYSLWGLGISSRGDLYMGDQNPTNPGIQIFDAATAEHVGFVSTRLAPAGNPIFVK